jgi:starvation-inducible DNA-binding protein
MRTLEIKKNAEAVPTKSSKKELVVRELRKIVSSQQVLRTKIQGFHWNVEGPYFKQLHELFGAQYEELEPKIDEVAERIRALGKYAPVSLNQMTVASAIDEIHEEQLKWETMVEILREDQLKMAELTRQASLIASAEEDPATASMLDDLTSMHQKSAWMLNSTLN